MGAKIGFQQKISPFRQAKQYLKYLEGLMNCRAVIKESRLSLSMNRLFYAGHRFLVDYVVG
jgi:hypothetical protein